MFDLTMHYLRKTSLYLLRGTRFSLRTLLLITLIFAVVCAYLGKHVIRASKQRPVVARIIAEGGEIGYDYQIHPKLNFFDRSRVPTGSTLVRYLLGDDIFATVTMRWIALFA